MDCKDDKPSDFKSPEGRKEPMALLNGVVVTSGPFTNGYPAKPVIVATGDNNNNDGSGSEGSCGTTPKKRRSQRSSPKTLELEKVSLHADGEVVVVKTPAPNLRGRNVEGKTVKRFEERPVKAKQSVAVKEDAWTLFKPPPVFPVDNSSARIVPKISYASKVKENLNKSDIRPPQVPMSAVKTVVPASFINGPLPDEGVFFSPAANAQNVAPPADDTSDHIKPGLVVCAANNMQPTLPSGRQADPPSQKVLGDIFQNEWGLSFINEPSAGPEGAGRLADFLVRTSPPSLGELGKLSSPSVPPSECWTQSRPPEPPECGTADHGAILLSPATLDSDVGVAEMNPKGGGATEGGHAVRCSWGTFDLKAAVFYHTKEMDHVWSLQRQDPKRVVLYDESQDGADQ